MFGLKKNFPRVADYVDLVGMWALLVSFPRMTYMLRYYKDDKMAVTTVMHDSIYYIVVQALIVVFQPDWNLAWKKVDKPLLITGLIMWVFLGVFLPVFNWILCVAVIFNMVQSWMKTK